MTATIPDLEAFLVSQIDSIPEITCEEDHHSQRNCSVTVKWSAPAYPCNCVPRHLACQKAYDYVFSANFNDALMYCCHCNRRAPIEEWRKGWCPV